MSKQDQKKFAIKIALVAGVSLLCAASLFVCVGSLLFPEVFVRHTFARFFVFFLTFFILFQSVLFVVLANKYIGQPLIKLARRFENAQNPNLFLHTVPANDNAEDEITEVIHLPTSGQNLSQSDQKKTQTSQRVNAELAEAFEDIALLYTVSQHLNSIMGLDELIRMARVIFTEKFSCHGFALYFVLPRNQRMRLVAHKETQDDFQSTHQQLFVMETVAREVFTRRHNIYIGDLTNAQESRLVQTTHLMKGSIFSIPLVVGGEIIGVLVVNRKTAQAFSPTERQSLDAIASQVAVAFDRARLYTKTKELAVKDELTGLYNRRHFQQMLNLEFKRAERFHRPISLLMIDVDFFKKFNDTYGHLKGDDVLKLLANVLKTNIREVDLVARFGGEEFVVVLPNTPFADATKVANKLKEMVRSRLKITTDELSDDSTALNQAITVSIGVSAYPDCARTPKALINTADIALYKAKRDGRNTVRQYELTLLEMKENELKIIQQA